MVNVGIIGLGPLWETRYRPALEKLRQRITVRAMYDPVASRADQAASQCGAAVVEGVLGLLGRLDVQAILLLEVSWHGCESLRFVCSGPKPVFIAAGLGDDAARLQQLHETARAEGRTLMSELGRRYTPATGRLQELMATRIGRPQRIVIDAVVPGSHCSDAPAAEAHRRHFVVGLLDWCCYIVRTAPLRLHTKPLDSAVGDSCRDCSIKIEFCRPRSGGGSAVAELRLHDPQSSPANNRVAQDATTVHHEILCERGKAVLEAPNQICWSSNSDTTTEFLSAERSEVEVMLDLFCRRLVGGLVPVADLGDLCHGMKLSHAAEESLRSGRTIPLNGRH